MFVSPALAQAAGAPPAGPGGFESMIPLILIFVVFYFLLIRPQQTKQKQHKAMLEVIRRGDRVVTGGGIVGTVRKVIDDKEVQVEIADNVRVRVRRDLISTVLAKTEPVKESQDNKKPSKDDDSGDDDDKDDSAQNGKKGGLGLKNLFGGKK